MSKKQNILVTAIAGAVGCAAGVATAVVANKLTEKHHPNVSAEEIDFTAAYGKPCPCCCCSEDDEEEPESDPADCQSPEEPDKKGTDTPTPIFHFDAATGPVPDATSEPKFAPKSEGFSELKHRTDDTHYFCGGPMPAPDEDADHQTCVSPDEVEAEDHMDAPADAISVPRPIEEDK